MNRKSTLEILWFLKLSLTLAGCGILDNTLPKLILISMDGFRYDYLDRFFVNETSNFQYFIKNGVKAKYIRNVFPTVTYPNHYTLITGLYPESHGLVHNRFYDPNLLEHFWYDNRMDNFDPMWFDNGAEPIYVTNHKAGSNRKSGSVLWPAGLGKVKCIAPDYIIPNADPFNETAMETRIDYLMDWFTDKNNPINLGLLYFPEPDETAHKYGPDSPVVNGLIKGTLNDALGYLKRKLEEANMLDSTNIIITSDHGFATVTKLINLDDYIPESWYEMGSLWHNHITVHLFPKPGKFTNINASWPGSAHDSHVFRNSKLCDFLEGNNRSLEDGILLGDSGYACMPYLLTPYRNPDNPSKQEYQQRHTSTRVTIERTFGRWKRRFHVLHSEIKMKPGKVCRIAIACAVLHNIAIMFNEPDPEDSYEDNEYETPQTPPYTGRETGRDIRDHITNEFFSN